MVFNSANESKPLFEFNYYTASKWTLMTLNALSYSVTIPPHSSVIIEFSYPFHGISLTNPLLTYYETPFYGTSNFQPFDYNMTYNIDENLIATFTPLDIDLSAEGRLLMIGNDNKIVDLKSIKKSVNASGSVAIIYSEPQIGYKGAMISITVQSDGQINSNFTHINSGHLGWDGIQNVSIDGFKCLAQNGYSFYIGRIYRSIGIPDINGIQNIKNARAAGWKNVDGYIFPCLRIGCPRPKDQIEAAINRVKAEGAQIDMLWLSIRQNEWPPDMAYNRLFVLELIKHAETMGVKLGIYTSRDNWDLIVGLDWNGGCDKPLWYALWNGKPNFDEFTPFGGWKVPSIHHFKVTAPGPRGVEMNYNWYS